jgi:biopolymer transport protein TolR
MAMSTGGGRRGLNSDINVTPLVDVMLVLLIIMMLIAPLITNEGVIQMPEAAHTGEKPDIPERTVVVIDSRGGFYVNALPVHPDNLIPQVQRVLEAKKEKVVYIKGDKDAKYSAVMDAMDAFRNAQIENIALITEKKNTPGGGN